MKKKLSPSIIAHFPHVWSNQYWGTPNGVPQQASKACQTFILGNMKYIYHHQIYLSYLNTEMAQLVAIIPVDDKDLKIIHL